MESTVEHQRTARRRADGGCGAGAHPLQSLDRTGDCRWKKPTHLRTANASLTSRLPAANVGSTERLVTLVGRRGAVGLRVEERLERPRPGLSWTAGARRDRLLPGYAAVGIDHADTRQALVWRARRSHARIDHDQRARLNSSTVLAAARSPAGSDAASRARRAARYKRSRWTAKAFDQVPVTWNAEIINEVPFETIGWQTLPGEAIQHAGSVMFKPACRATAAPKCACTCNTRAPGGKAGELACGDGWVRIRRS